MARKSNAFTLWFRALATTLRNLHVPIFVIVPYAILLGVADWLIEQRLGVNPTSGDQYDLIKLALSWTATALVAEMLVGPLLWGTAVYLARTATLGKPASPYQGLNFALARYSRMFKWHLVSQLMIQVGMIALVPGILYLQRYAFVDAICCLEKEKWPLARSTRLTRGRRATIFGIFLPLFVYTQVSIFALSALLQYGWMGLAAGHAAALLLVFLTVVAFTFVYEERTASRKPKPAIDGSSSPAGDDEGAEAAPEEDMAEETAATVH